METKELVLLLENTTAQLELYEKAKAGDNQSVVDFVRLSVLRKVFENDSIPPEKKIPTYESLMNLVHLGVNLPKEKQNG